MTSVLSKKCITEYFTVNNENSYIELGKYILRNLMTLNINEYTPSLVYVDVSSKDNISGNVVTYSG